MEGRKTAANAVVLLPRTECARGIFTIDLGLAKADVVNRADITLVVIVV